MTKLRSHTETAVILGMQPDTLKPLYDYYRAQTGVTDENCLSVQDTVNFLLDNGEIFGAATGDNLNGLIMARTLINASVSETRFTAPELAGLLNMKASDAEGLYLLYIAEYGDTSSWRLSPQEFIGFTVDVVLPDEAFSDYVDSDTAERLKAGKLLIDAVVSEKEYALSEMYSLLKGFAGDVSQNEIELLYLYYAAFNYSDAEWTMSLAQLFEYLKDSLIGDERFAGILGEEAAAGIAEGKATIDDALAQMKGEKYSRLILTTDYPEESAETSAYMERLDGLRKTHLKNDSYIVGTSAMVYEMEIGFGGEFLAITLITAVAIFLVVLIAFRNLIIPALLTLLVQCGVFITVSVIGINGGTMYYLALLIVQSILMGATIDYGIVFSNYYREFRQTMDKADAVKAAYENSIHTIMTSGSILILVTGILGIFSEAQVVSQVTLTISIGSLVAVLLILLVLPGTLDFFDRFAVKKSNG